MIDLRKIEERERFWTLPDRRMTMPFSLILAAGFILILTVVLDSDGRAAQLILDRKSPHFPYPFTIQNF